MMKQISYTYSLSSMFKMKSLSYIATVMTS